MSKELLREIDRLGSHVERHLENIRHNCQRQNWQAALRYTSEALGYAVTRQNKVSDLGEVDTESGVIRSSYHRLDTECQRQILKVQHLAASIIEERDAWMKPREDDRT